MGKSIDTVGQVDSAALASATVASVVVVVNVVVVLCRCRAMYLEEEDTGSVIGAGVG